MAALAVASCLLAMLCGFLLLFRSKRKTEEVRNDEKKYGGRKERDNQGLEGKKQRIR